MEILNHIDGISKKRGIPYYLAFGTLLGAIRHQGFIPWDDDIDIVVPRVFYNEFLDAIECESSRFTVFTMYNNGQYMNPWAKVVDKKTILVERNEKKIDGMGVFVDIFPLDNIPSSILVQKIFFIKARVYKWIRYFGNKSNKEYNEAERIERIKIKIAKSYGYKRALKKLDNLCKSCVNQNTKLVGVPVYGAKHYIFLKSDFSDGKKAKFESRYYSIPKEAENVLTVLYGDYLKLPPYEARVAKHNFDAFIKE